MSIRDTEMHAHLEQEIAAAGPQNMDADSLSDARTATNSTAAWSAAFTVDTRPSDSSKIDRQLRKSASEPTLKASTQILEKTLPRPWLEPVHDEKAAELDPKPQDGNVDPRDIFFCFGRETGEYLFKSPNDLLYNVPIQLANILEEAPIKRIFSASVGKDGAAWIHFEQADGRKCQYRSSSLVKKYPKLEKWIAKMITNDNGPLTVAFGPKAAYAAFSTTTQKFVAKGFDKSLTQQFNIFDSCEVITFGCNTDHGILGSAGTERLFAGRWNVGREWHSVDEKLRNAGIGLRHVALSISDPEHFFILTKTSEAYYCVDDSFQSRLRTALENSGIKCHPCTGNFDLDVEQTQVSADRPATVADLDQALRRFDQETRKKQRDEAFRSGLLLGVITGACTVM